MSLNQRLDTIAQKLPTKLDTDLSKLTTEQLRYLADGLPIPTELLTPEAIETLGLDNTKEVTK